MTLFAAIGSRDITPSGPAFLSGFAVRTERATGTLDPLSVRALLLRKDRATVALVSYDLIGVPDELEALVHARMPDWQDVQLILCATHTHAAPPVLSRAILGDVDHAYLERLAGETATLLEGLLGTLTPVHLSAGKTFVPNVAVNRRDPQGPLDPFADVIALHGERELLGVWVNYACHPVALGPDNLQFSADIPGAVRATLEAHLNVPVLYTTGCAGQINTGHRAEDSITLHGLERRTPQVMQALGRRIADAVLARLTHVTPSNFTETLRYERQRVTIEFEADEEAHRCLADRAQAVVHDPAATPGERAMAYLDLAWLKRTLPRHLTLSVGVLHASSVRAVFLPGEMFVETALRLQAAFKGVSVTAYAYANPGYIPDASAYAQGGYEVDGAYRPYGLLAPFPIGSAEQLEAVARTLLQENS